MERIKKKIQSQSGASFLFALLTFLVAAMVSVTIVSAAVTTVKRVHSDREAQQAQLTLISAAQLVRDEMEKTRYVRTTITSTPYQEGDGVTDNIAGVFGAEMQSAVQKVEDYNADASGTFTMNVAGLDMDAVDVSFVMKAEKIKKYRVIFTITIADSDEKLFLTMSGQRSEEIKYSTKNIIGPEGEETEETITTTTKTETYSWDSGVIDGIGDANESET